MLNLDTHILIHALAGTIKREERELLESNPWSISAIVLWEIAKLFQLGRTTLDIHSLPFGRAMNRIHVWPLDLTVAGATKYLDFRSDAADEIIAATSVVYSVPLVTRDRKIRKSKLVPIAGRI